jgi:tRNA (guanine26-N2/guanine27-N2)-dimethyltransferase
MMMASNSSSTTTNPQEQPKSSSKGDDDDDGDNDDDDGKEEEQVAAVSSVSSSSSLSSFQTIVEGSTTMRYPAHEESTVFYNPVQVQNRDLSILMITLITERRAVRQAVEQYGVKIKNLKRLQQHLQPANTKSSVSQEEEEEEEEPKVPPQQHQSPHQQTQQQQQLTFRQQLAAYEQELLPQAEQVLAKQIADSKSNNSTTGGGIGGGIDILDALAASGLRSLRYFQEIPGVRHVTINDLDVGAIQRAHDNIHVNGLQQYYCHQATITTNTNTNQNNSTSIQQRPAGIRLQVGDAMHELYMSRTPPPPSSTAGSTIDSAATPSSSSSNDKDKSSSLPYQQQQQPTQTQWDVIDLDPYGSAAPFIDGAVQAIVHGGLLCVTCTDMAALGGSHPETCFGRYHGSMPLQRASYLQEMAVRIVLYALATAAAKYGRTIHPVLSVGMDFYIRIFCTVHDDKAAVAKLSLNIGQVYQSTQCQSFFIVPSGQMGGKKGTVYHAGRIQTSGTNGSSTGKTMDVTTGEVETKSKAQDSSNDDHKNGNSKDKIMVDAAGSGTFKIGGPIWLGPMHDKGIVQDALKRLEALPLPSTKQNDESPSSSSPLKPSLRFISTRDRLRGLLSNCLEELPDAPLFYKLGDMASSLHQSTPPRRDFCAALQNAGYQVSGYHKDPQAVKTNAPDPVVWDILKTWCRIDQERNPAKKAAAPRSVAERIMNHHPPYNSNIRVDFTPVPGGVGIGRKRGGDNDVARFPLNPQANWGPKKAATGAGAPRNKKQRKGVQEQDNAKEADS